MAQTTSLSLLLLLCLTLQAPLTLSQVYIGGGGLGNSWGYTWNYNRNNNNINSVQTAQEQQACQQQFTDCMYKGDVANSLAPRVSNGQTLTATQDMALNYDMDRNGCVTGQEFITTTTSRGFSVEYARYLFNAKLLSGVGVNNAVCPGSFSTAALLAAPQVAGVTAATISNNMIQPLIVYCNQDTRRYLTNCDCIQLPAACNKAPFQTTPACITFKARYANYNSVCPFSTGAITSAKLICANNNLSTNTQLTPLLRILCNNLNQKAPTIG